MFYRIESFGFTWLLRNSFLLFYLFSTVMLLLLRLVCFFLFYGKCDHLRWMDDTCIERKRVYKKISTNNIRKTNIQPGDRISFRLSTTLEIESKFLHLSSSSPYLKTSSIVTNNNAILYNFPFFYIFK